MRGADLIWSRLADAGITTCFANPGTSEMHLVSALDRAPSIRGILCLQENVATGAADGYGRMADRPAVTLLHLGPGLANGLANLHNARRARTPILNLVGDYNAEHRELDAPLASDIGSLARPMSDWVGEIRETSELPGVMIAAIDAASRGIATLTVGADVTWSECDDPQQSPAAAKRAPAAPLEDTQNEVAAALRDGEPTTFILSGKALRAGPLADMAAIASRTGARFYARGANARIERGRGRVAIDRLPYAAEPATRMLAGTRRLVLVDATVPTTFFPYPGQRALVHPEGCTVTTLCPPGGDAAAALAELARRIGAPAVPRDDAPLSPSSAPGALSLAGLNAIMAKNLPEGAIVCDEVITSGGFYALSADAAPHDYLQLTGGAIGAGIPMALGAAIASPGRRVVALQADGSGLYTLQGLWTMAREALDVTIVVFANRAYRILQNEMRKVGVDTVSETAAAMLSLDNPAPSWVELARGFGVEAARAESIDRFGDLWRHATCKSGPFLIEAAIE